MADRSPPRRAAETRGPSKYPHQTPSRQRRSARRAAARAVQTAAEIQGTARARTTARATGNADAAAAKGGDLDNLYGEYRGDKRDLYATGLVPEGTEYKGRVSNVKGRVRP